MHAAKYGEILLITSTIALLGCISAGEAYPASIADDTKQMSRDFLWSVVAMIERARCGLVPDSGAYRLAPDNSC
ncbi:hypothetical protein DMC47_20015 [Nostoc sp. 3335mG]|nr:hypothetical protein DMC47_20015 [Nostoc sp. 3335mG]